MKIINALKYGFKLASLNFKLWSLLYLINLLFAGLVVVPLLYYLGDPFYFVIYFSDWRNFDPFKKYGNRLTPIGKFLDRMWKIFLATVAVVVILYVGSLERSRIIFRYF